MYIVRLRLYWSSHTQSNPSRLWSPHFYPLLCLLHNPMRTAALAFVSLASLASFRRVAAHKRPNASMAWHCSSATNDGLISNLEGECHWAE